MRMRMRVRMCCIRHVRGIEGDAAEGPRWGVGEAVRVHKGEHAPLLQQRVTDADLVVRSTSVLAAVACTTATNVEILEGVIRG